MRQGQLSARHLIELSTISTKSQVVPELRKIGFQPFDPVPLSMIKVIPASDHFQYLDLERFRPVLANSTIKVSLVTSLGSITMLFPTLFEGLGCLSHISFVIDSISDFIDDIH
jgi:hypothetical protein